jgi:carbamoylphosphate synthase large subunit
MFVVITYPPYKRNVANSLHKKKHLRVHIKKTDPTSLHSRRKANIHPAKTHRKNSRKSMKNKENRKP